MSTEPHIENEMDELGMVDSAKLAMGEVISTLKEYKSFKTLFVYMLAYFLFIDGINSVTALAGVFGKAVLGLTTFDNSDNSNYSVRCSTCCNRIYKISRQVGHKESPRIFHLVCWVIVIIGALSFAPLIPEAHEDFDLQYTWDDDTDSYLITFGLLEK